MIYKSKTKTIGLIIPNLVGDYHKKQWDAVNRVTQKAGVNLVIFSPFLFYSHQAYTEDYFKTFTLAGVQNVDGLIISTGSLHVFCDQQKLSLFCERYRPLPIVSIAEPLPGVPTILIDNKKGMFELIKHFTNHHGYRKIAFIRGPERNSEAQERFAAYKDALSEKKIPFDEALILQGDFGLPSGKEAIVELVDRRGIIPEAIIAANDDMILGAYHELNARKLTDQIRFAGFDDIEMLRNTDPMISSVRQPFEEQAEKAAEILLQIMDGEEIKSNVVLEAVPVIRESCGCSIVSESYGYQRKFGNSGEEDYAGRCYNIGSISLFYTSINYAVDGGAISEQLKSFLPQLDIHSCFINYYNKGMPITLSKQESLPGNSEVSFFLKDEVFEGNKTGVVFPTMNLVPDEAFFQKRRLLLCSELVFQFEHYGFIVMEFPAEIDPLMLHLLLVQLTNCVQSIFMRNELVKAIQKLKDLDVAKSNFFANISHEFRTPLTLILSPIEAVLQGEYGKLIPNDDPIFKSMARNSFRLLKLINNLLDLTKIDAGAMSLKKQRTNIDKLLSYYVSSVQSGAQAKGLCLNYINQSTRMIISDIDRDLFEKAFFNLVSNSMKFTPAGGTVTVTLSCNDEKYFIVVCDNGIGIKKENLNKIFERFGQADNEISRQAQGSGIGLTFVREIMSLHEGFITVESEIGKGSSFTMAFPFSNHQTEINQEENIFDDEIKRYLVSDIIDVDHLEEPRQANGLEPESVLGNESSDLVYSVLVCDDDQDMRNFICSILKKKYKIITAANGQEALDKIKLKKPDLLISDVMMPVMDGYELCNILKVDPDFRNIPIILLTANVDMGKKIEGLEYGADDYLMKPFNVRELILRVNVFLSREIARKNLEDRSKHLFEVTQKDSLTNLYNHKYFLEQFQKRFTESRTRSFPLSIMMIDIDFFKGFNDTYGHQLGDLVIKKMAEVIVLSTRDHDIKGRYGGDEFAVALPFCSKEHLPDVLGRLEKNIREIILIHKNQEIRIGASIGVAVLAADTVCNNSAALFELADKALYIAKERGRNQSCTLNFEAQTGI